MKFKSIISSAVLVAASVLFISVAPAQAGECSAEDPCHTYAMVNDAVKSYKLDSASIGALANAI